MKIIFWAILFSFSFKVWGNKCLENRAAINMGAYNTKLVVGQIDFCKIKIVKFLLEKEVVLNFADPLKGKSEVSLALQISAMEKLKKMVDLANRFNPVHIAFIPSKFFKTTTNYMSFFKKIREDLKVKIFLPDLETEAILGFLGVKIKYPQAPNKLLVWDMGANGSNWTMLDKNLDFKVYFEKMNPKTFKNMVIEGVLKKDYKQVSSPNPLGDKNTKKALDLIKLYSSYNTPEILKKRAKEFKVVGIGGFHNKSIMNQLGVGGSSYNLKQLESALGKVSSLSDKEIKGPFPSYQVTNLILAMGLLNTLGLDIIYTTNVNEAHGALMYPKYWKITSK